MDKITLSVRHQSHNQTCSLFYFYFAIKVTLIVFYLFMCFNKTSALCDNQLNNLCERYNLELLNAREKSVLTMLDMIREYICNQFISKRNEVSNWKNSVSKNIMNLIDANIRLSSTYGTTNIGRYLFEVYFDFNKKVNVDLLNTKCTCKEWDIIGIPYIHAMRCSLVSKRRILLHM